MHASSVRGAASLVQTLGRVCEGVPAQVDVLPRPDRESVAGPQGASVSGDGSVPGISRARCNRNRARELPKGFACAGHCAGLIQVLSARRRSPRFMRVTASRGRGRKTETSTHRRETGSDRSAGGCLGRHRRTTRWTAGDDEQMPPACTRAHRIPCLFPARPVLLLSGARHPFDRGPGIRHAMPVSSPPPSDRQYRPKGLRG